MSNRHPMVPVVSPHTVDDFYSPAEVDALFGVVKNHGPWPLITALHFKSAEEYLAVSGGANLPKDAKLSDFISPSFRGYLGKEGVCFYDEVHDIYFSKRLKEIAKKVHGAEYAMTSGMLFNIAGPSHSFDAGHFDTASWRGLTLSHTPIWVLAVIAKSGLFEQWKVTTAQVITYFYESGIDGGFTYWPNGPHKTPQRFVPPFHNTAIVSDNSQMYHRREANGPLEMRDYPDLDIHTLVEWAGNDEWVMRNDGVEIARFHEENRRALFHWTGLVFKDKAEVDTYLEHKDDLTLDKVFEILIADMQSKGISFTEPSDPLDDAEFIALLTRTYDMAPKEYPADAPMNVKRPEAYV